MRSTSCRSAERIDAEEALRIGLVNEVVEPELLLPRATEIARSWAERPGVGVPSLKALLQAAAANDIEEQLELEARYADTVSSHPDRGRARAAKVEAIQEAGPRAKASNVQTTSDRWTEESLWSTSH